ncbi:MAG: hypothetical protein QF805_05030 [Pirellulaceae bacterium]|nr:hypothetical protein [Pirellulaceae bacterium]
MAQIDNLHTVHVTYQGWEIGGQGSLSRSWDRNPLHLNGGVARFLRSDLMRAPLFHSEHSIRPTPVWQVDDFDTGVLQLDGGQHFSPIFQDVSAEQTAGKSGDRQDDRRASQRELIPASFRHSRLLFAKEMKTPAIIADEST